MKKITIVLSLILSFNLAQAKLKIPVCIPCENIAVVKDLPQTDEFKDDKGNYLKLGYMYKEYGIVFIPFWNTDGKYVLTNEAADSYMELDDATISTLKDTHKVEISKGSPLSFWKKIGGKIVGLIILALIVWGALPDKSEKKANNNEQN